MQLSLSAGAALGVIFVENVVAALPEVKIVFLESTYDYCEMSVQHPLDAGIRRVRMNGCISIDEDPVKANKSAKHNLTPNHGL
jgi:hypothetical protein